MFSLPWSDLTLDGRPNSRTAWRKSLYTVIHLYAIHYVYVPRINKALREFKEGWNNHPIRTENNTSPHQLFVVQSLQLQRSGLVALDFFVQVNSNYGIEEEGLVSDNSEGAKVPQVQFQLTEEHHTDLRQHV